MSMLLLPFEAGMDMGVGVNAITGEVKGAAFKYESLDKEDRKGRDVERDRSMISTSEQYQEKIAAAAAAQGSGCGWSASGSVSHVRETQKGSTSLILLDTVVVKAGGTEIRDSGKWRLNPSAEKSLRNNPAKFIQDYGTHFVSGIQSGGSYVGMVRISTESSKQVDSLKSALEAGFNGAISASGKASFSTELQKTAQQYDLSASSRTTGAEAKSYILGNLDQMMAAADEFEKAGEEKDRWGPLIATCHSWDFLPCVKSILSETGTTLASELNPEVCKMLTQEMLRLEYVGAAVEEFLDRELYVGTSQHNTLNRLNREIRTAREAIWDLSMDALSDMKVADAFDWLKAPGFEDEFAPIDAEECTIMCRVTRYGWSITSSAKGDRTHGEDYDLFRFDNVRPSDAPVSVLSARHTGGANGVCRFYYSRVTEAGDPALTGERKVRAVVDVPRRWHGSGQWVKPGEDSTSEDKGGMQLTACISVD